MKIITKLEDGLDIFSALNSKVRIRIINLLNEKHNLSITEIAEELKISNSTLTPHIKKLEKAGIIHIRLNQDTNFPSRICSLSEDKIIVQIIPELTEYKSYDIDLNVGKYFDYSVIPTCGLASTSELIGNLDDPRFFSHPDRFNAGIIWFSEGYVEYRIPNMITLNDQVEEIQISFEICSEAPGVLSHYPSDIYFIVNDQNLGYWTSPGELFDRKGRHTPKWWFSNFSQYGRMKVITINQTGTYLDGLLLSPIKIEDLALNNSPEISIKFEVPSDARNVGGITLFGHGFGDYEGGIKVKTLYKEKN